MQLVNGPILPNDCALFEAGYNYFLTQKWGFGCTDDIIEIYSSQLKRVMTCNELVDVECYPAETDDCVRKIEVLNKAYDFVYPEEDPCGMFITIEGGDAEAKSYITTPQINVDPCQE